LNKSGLCTGLQVYTENGTCFLEIVKVNYVHAGNWSCFFRYIYIFL